MGLKTHLIIFKHNCMCTCLAHLILLLNSTGYEAPHYSVFSSILLYPAS
jgi:hypothetical protein